MTGVYIKYMRTASKFLTTPKASNPKGISTQTRLWPFCLLSLVGHMAIAWELWRQIPQEDPVFCQGIAVEWINSSCGGKEMERPFPQTNQAPPKNDKGDGFVQKVSQDLNKEIQKPAAVRKPTLPSLPLKKTSEKFALSLNNQTLCEEDAGGGESEELIPLSGNAEPPYPLEARRQGIEGTVMARLTILPDGSVQKVDIISKELGIFRESVLQTLKTWKFQARRSSKPVVVEIPIIFSL